MATVGEWNANDNALQPKKSTDQPLYTGIKRSTSPRPQNNASKRNQVKLDKENQATVSKRSGRKPVDSDTVTEATNDPKLKRKAQNRAAQRAFRERKEKFVAELQERIRELEDKQATNDQALMLENKRLKEQLKSLQEENEALKGAQFTFEYPLTDNLTYASTPQLESDANSGPRSRSEAPPKGDDSWSSEASHFEFSPDAGQGFGNAINSFVSPIPPHHDFDFLAIPETADTLDLDLFIGKENLFSDYRIPITDDQLLGADPLPPFLGPDVDLFGLSAPAPLLSGQPSTLDTSALPETSSAPASATSLHTNTQQDIHQDLLSAKAQGMNPHDVMQTLAPRYPGYNIDLLCDDLKSKATCSKYSAPITENEMESFLRCFGGKQ